MITLRGSRRLALFACLLLGGTALWAPESPSAAAEPKLSQVGSDFNGDGYSDLAVHLVAAAGGGDGEIAVLLGSSRGLTPSGSQRLRAADFGPLLDPKSKPEIGRVLATGNFDGDRYADLALSDDEGAVGEIERAGLVRVVYGSAQGLDPGRTQVWSQESPGVPGRAEDDNNFGWALTTGDFGRGREDDLAITSWTSEFLQAGVVTVLYGSSGGLKAADSQSWSSSTPGVRGAPEDGEMFGESLAAGRFSGSGYDDLAIGIPGQTVDRHARAGAVVVLRGSEEGLTTRGSRRWTQNSAGVVGRAQHVDSFGDSLAAGQFGRSDHEDLAVGAPDEKIANRTSAGAVNILYGSAAGLSATGNQMRSQRSPGVAGIPEKDDKFGDVLAAGDFGGNGTARGFDDLAVSAPQESVRGGYLAGQVHVLLGGPLGVSSSRNQVLSRATPGLTGRADLGSGMGSALAAGDFAHRPSERRHDDLVVGLELDIGAHQGRFLVLSASSDESQTVAAQLWTPVRIGAPDRGIATMTAASGSD